MRKKNNTQEQKLLLKNFLNAKNFYGSKINNVQKNIFPYLYGIRSKQCVINLDITINTFQRIFKLMRFLLNNKQEILIIGNNVQSEIFKNIFLIKQVSFVSTKFLKAFSSNTVIKENQYNIGLVIFLSTCDNEIFLKKIFKLNKPVISIFDTNIKMGIKDITYPIVNNNTNLKSLFFLVYIIRNLLKKIKNESF